MAILEYDHNENEKKTKILSYLSISLRSEIQFQHQTKTETAQEILDGFKMKFMIAITLIFFGSMVAAFIWLFIKSNL